MSNIISFVKKIWFYVSIKIWGIRLDKINKRKGNLIKQIRILSLAIKGFNEDKCFTKATALTFYTIFSIVPILALIFAVSKSFGYEKNIQIKLLASYPEYIKILTPSFEYANSVLANAKGGIIAGIGIVLLGWSILKLLISIEQNFNEIWGIKQGRTWIRKLTDYLTLMVISPLLLIIAGGLIITIETRIVNSNLFGFLNILLIKLFAYALISTVFAFLYFVLPNTKVKFKSAVIAGILSSILFQLLQWTYLKFQIGANSMNAIYGGFAALPLFLIWVQYSWFVVLFGAEIAFANQNVSHYELENEIEKLSFRYKKVISIMIANIVAKAFYNSEKPLSSFDISKKLDLPHRLTQTIINEFTESGIFIELKIEDFNEIIYQPGVTESKFTVNYLIDTLEKKGVNSLPINETLELIQVNELMKKIDKSIETEFGNTLIMKIV